MLEVKKLSFSYDQNPIFENFDLIINKGELVLLNGQNGSGKTTLLKCIAGIINGGKDVYLNDIELKNNKKSRDISYIMSEDTLYEYLTVSENINFFRELFDESEEFVKSSHGFISMFMLDEYKDYLVKNLSKGMRQKVYLSIMLSKKAEVFIFDEPFSSLDVETQEKIKTILIELAENNKYIIYSTHIQEFKELAYREIKLKTEEK